MPATLKPKSKTQKVLKSPSTNGVAHSVHILADVLTLAQAAAYLQLSEGAVIKLHGERKFPGQCIEGQWRFLRSEIVAWLKSPATKSGKDSLRSLIGVWEGDPDIDGIVKDAMRRRGRPNPEEVE